MCITFDKIPKLHKTIKNHTVYKVFRNDDNGYLWSPYSLMKWSINELKEEKGVNIIIKNTTEKTKIQSENGLYCFKNKSLAKELLNKLEIYRKINPFFSKNSHEIAVCVMPKDSIYYEQNGVIVTNKLKPIKIL